MNWGLIALLCLLGILLIPGLLSMWYQRNDGKWKIEPLGDGVVLYYNYRGEWLKDSVHANADLARERIHKLATRLPHRIRP